jgi:hypothetical protein
MVEERFRRSAQGDLAGVITFYFGPVVLSSRPALQLITDQFQVFRNIHI